MSVKKYSKENNLEYIEFKTNTSIQYRVKKGDKYIDFWPNGSHRDISGKFLRRGASNRGWGADDVNFYSSTTDDGAGFLQNIKDEIIKLTTLERK